MPHKADTTVICQCGGPTNLLTNPHITTTTTTFMPHKVDTTVICQCGAMGCKYYTPKHLCQKRPMSVSKETYVCVLWFVSTIRLNICALLSMRGTW